MAPELCACPHCETAFALVSCPSCFARIFEAAQHCPSGGAEVSRGPAAPRPARPRPECRRDLAAVKAGSVTPDECVDRGGVFVDRPSFERICAEREQQAVVLGARFPAPASRLPAPSAIGPARPAVAS